jgi:hypothetical protein
MEIRKIINNISYLTIILFVGLIGLLFFWSIYPYKPLVLNNVRLNKTEVNRGEHLLVSADYCKNTNKQADLFISFIDGLVYNPQPQVINLEKGCHHATLSIYVPKALPIGEFKLKGVFRYKINPIRIIEFINITENFTVK